MFPIQKCFIVHKCVLWVFVDRVETLEGYFGVSARRDGAQGSLFWFEIPYRPDADSASSCSPKAGLMANAGNGTSNSLLHSPSPSVKANAAQENGSAGKNTNTKYTPVIMSVFFFLQITGVQFLSISNILYLGMKVKSRFLIFSWWMIRRLY